MEEIVFQAALAGLLHDVGKVEQRARIDPWNPAPDLASEGQPVHATWSIYFSQNYVPARYRAAALAGGYHHKPSKSPAVDKQLSDLIALADKLSAGERVDPVDANTSKNPPQQIISIFDQVKLDSRSGTQVFHYLPLSALSLDEKIIFPAGLQSKEEQGKSYDILRDRLERIIQQDCDDPETYLENVLAALQFCCWCIPSAYYHSLPDVSLYDHSRMTAALAVCLSEFEASQVTAFLTAVERDFQGKSMAGDEAVLNQPVALLIGGDISGIQDFIYTLSSKGAARTLRGRSFYLQLLTEAILRFVLRELHIPYTNVIYTGGGHFYLLAPLSAEKELGEVRRRITSKLLIHHSVSLYLAMGSTPVPASGFKAGNFPAYWSQMHQDINRVKNIRYTELGEHIYSQVFETQAHGGNREKTCSVCGEEDEHVKKLDDPDDPNAKICSLCSSFAERIGSQLPEARFIALGLGKPQETPRGSALDMLRAFGMRLQFVDHQAIEFDEPVERVILWALADPDQWPETPNLPAARLLRYTVNLIPRVVDQAEANNINNQLTSSERKRDPAMVGGFQTFTHLQAQAEGIKRLGVLRMDVDDLGEIFRRGLVDAKGESLATLARVSTLSFQISLFFEGWIKRLCEEYPGSVYAVYAGGDDVFLIGPWHIMPELAHRITKDLNRFTGGNPDVHASGGLAFIHGKYPVYQAAEDAHSTLDEAKEIDSHKNAFSFLGQAWKWSDFEKIIEKEERLRKLVSRTEEGGLGGPQAILQWLRHFAQEEADLARRKKRPVWGPWMWLTPYLLTRMAERARTNELKQELLNIRDSLVVKNFTELNQWGTAARWTQILLRE